MSEKFCVTPGCYESAYGNDYCGYCLDDKPPMERGPVTNFEAMRARLLGGEDEAICRARLIKHGQPTAILD